MDDLHTFGGGSAASWEQLGFDGTSAGQAASGSLSVFFNGSRESPPLEYSPESASATVFIDQCLKCPTARCAVHKCRRQTDKYPRGQCVVCDSCPKHLRTYLRCVQCQKTIHVGCDDGVVSRLSWTGNWKCSSCITDVVQGAGADVPHVGASAGVGTSASASDAATAANSDATCSSVIYEDFDSMHCAVRSLGFHVKTTNYIRKNGAVTTIKSSLYWECTKCFVRFASSAVNGGTSEDSEWRVSVKHHADGCTMANSPQDVDPVGDEPTSKFTSTFSSSILQHNWQLGNHKGVKESIEEMGASGVPPQQLHITISTLAPSPPSWLYTHQPHIFVGVHPSTPCTITTTVVVHPSTALFVGVHPSTPCRKNSR